MLDDDSARQAIRTLTDEPAPPVTTTIDQVLRRGRRRVFAQRVGATAGVMAVVAAIGVSAVLLRGGGDADNLQVADTTDTADTSPPTSSTGPRSSQPDSPVPPGWQQVPMPATMTRSGEHCEDTATPNLPPAPAIGLPREDRVRDAYGNAIKRITGDQPTMVTGDWTVDSPKPDAPRGYLVTELPIGGDVPGNGQLQLEVGRYGGTPDQLADASRTWYGNCDAPSRHTMADGTVLQLYQVDDLSPLRPTQHLHIYRPDNRTYVITSAGYSDADMKFDDDGSGTPIGGRGTLPTTPDELAFIGLELVANLG